MTRFLFGEAVFVAFIDVLGFKSAIEHSSGETVFNLWRNAFLPARNQLSDFPYTSLDTMLNFVQLSDSIVLYGGNGGAVTNLACNIFGGALVWGVPVRGGLGHGELFHLEDQERPGTALTLYGSGLIDAYRKEQSGQNKGMRLFASKNFLSYSPNLKSFDEDDQYPWWKEADVPYTQFLERSSAWWGSMNVGKWFKGPHRTDTEKVFNRALRELSDINQKH